MKRHDLPQPRGAGSIVGAWFPPRLDVSNTDHDVANAGRELGVRDKLGHVGATELCSLERLPRDGTEEDLSPLY